jgi:LCP family protein required for cell wall assembly
MALCVASVLVLSLTGTGWSLYRDVTGGITTTGALAGDDSDGAQNILLVGIDSRTDAHGNPLPQAVLDQLHAGPDTGVLNSDTIIVLHVPEAGGAATAFSIPRDSYVDIPGYRTDKINAAYPAMTALSAQDLVAQGQHDRAQIDVESRQAGRSALIGAVQELTGLTIDHYAEINLLGFANLTQAIGGVDVCLKNATSDELSGADFPAGPQTLTGANALAFVRQRHGLPQGDLSRIRRQQAFLAAVADKILHGGTLSDPSKISALVGVAQDSLVIDSGWDLLGFAQQAAGVAGGHMQFVTIPTTGLETNNRGDVVTVDPHAVHTFIEQKDAEAAAAAQEAADAPPPLPPAPPVTIEARRYVIDVRNGSSMSGLASDVMNHMRDLGFLRGTSGNTDHRDASVVEYTGADRGAAQAVAEQLGDIDVEKSDSTVAGHLLVVIGDDFNRTAVPAPPPAPGAPAPTPKVTDPITANGIPCID